jgi:ABC-2 type transport system permease protein
MFLRLFLYRLKSIFLQKDLTFWTLAFPLILGTFFYLGFGRLLNGTELELNTIPAAVVTVHENTAFETVLKEVEKSDGKALFDLTFTDEDTAIAMLKENKATGIFCHTAPDRCRKRHGTDPDAVFFIPILHPEQCI